MVACMELARDKLPGDTKMFDGHEYTVKNYKFAKVADPENPAIDQAVQDNNQKRAQGLWTCPSTLDIQKATNVFMRALDADMQAITGTNNATQCMGYLRQWKSKGKRPMF